MAERGWAPLETPSSLSEALERHVDGNGSAEPSEPEGDAVMKLPTEWIQDWVAKNANPPFRSSGDLALATARGIVAWLDDQKRLLAMSRNDQARQSSCDQLATRWRAQ